jgi:hypothetical protein
LITTRLSACNRRLPARKDGKDWRKFAEVRGVDIVSRKETGNNRARVPQIMVFWQLQTKYMALYGWPRKVRRFVLGEFEWSYLD